MVAVVLSSICLLVVMGLLMFWYHRRGGYDVENEEKVKLGVTTSHSEEPVLKQSAGDCYL